MKVRFEMRGEATWLHKVDKWAAEQSPPISRAEAVRRLADAGLKLEARLKMCGVPPVNFG